MQSDATHDRDTAELTYPWPVRVKLYLTFAGSAAFAILPLVVLAQRIHEGRPEKEYGAITLLVLGFGWAAVFLARHLRLVGRPVRITPETLDHGGVTMQWAEVVSVWNSGAFSMLRLKDSRGQVLTFLKGLTDYDDLCRIAVVRGGAHETKIRT